MKEILNKNCIVCPIKFIKPINCSKKNWANRKFCSKICMNKYWIGKPNGRKKQGSKNSVPAWNKGIPMSEEQKQIISGKLKVIAKEKGFGKWMLGKPTPDALRKKRSEYMKARVAKGVHNFYIDGRTPENNRIRHSIEYRDWRIAVFTRDNYTCQECGSRGVTLHADHIKPFAYFPELRLVIENGRTLCVPCHQKTDTYKGKALKYKVKTT